MMSGLSQSMIATPGPSGLQTPGPCGLQTPGPSGLQTPGPSGMSTPGPGVITGMLTGGPTGLLQPPTPGGLAHNLMYPQTPGYSIPSASLQHIEDMPHLPPDQVRLIIFVKMFDGKHKLMFY